ncbi:thiamine transporter 1 [Tribolium castaneum]|uniref:Thiamine transporter 1-like Protein n=1 Tax=Tribolium castaneum TaxID=7070 RepID=D2A676_TRICA|nr:PREDICTED: thiamine transporter 1 [Tribolium castaneum]XP_015836453.1 PREDICTED: thiamine transporter 1 [Tribolium castaneum]XP_015836454.1 PREDICTED: thiamine transporter 1 [Tribolium castaneum]XP_973943.1 PREDICTED: thiamine transporter 1 [Tribolium castaneum]EFA04966.1 Thiamine transporter 1-like Protein [Tribolium castaneum]|eukprot:XP_008194841.1 PREDICTED: thiamine transporter 1 [Tribolium castaneum]
MEPWMKISLHLCVFGFLKEIRPSEPFIYDYLIGPWRNLTEDEVTKQVYPVGTYANMILLVLVFLITDICRYKPLIVVLGLSGIAVWAMLIWTTSLFSLQVLEVIYGMFCASEVAYYTYIYAKVDKEHYQKVTSHTRGAILAGRAISGISSQVLVSTKWMDFKELNYITFAAVSLATLWALFLPSVDRSLYFHSDAQNRKFSAKVGSAFTLMRSHFMDAFTNSHVVKWSAWWALSTCGYVQIETYMQPLYSAVQHSNETAYNGAVEAILTLSGFLVALLAGYLKFNWEVKGELTLGVFSLVQGVLMVVISQTDYIFLCYAFYIVFGILYHFMVTIASAQIAKVIDEDSYGLIFGLNTFFALVCNSILTVLVATEGVGFALDARGQYVVYGGYHLAIALVFVIMGLRTCFGSRGVGESCDNIVDKAPDA